jgi:hypothetical protein
MEFADNQGYGLVTYRQETTWRHRAKHATIPAVWPGNKRQQSVHNDKQQFATPLHYFLMSVPDIRSLSTWGFPFSFSQFLFHHYCYTITFCNMTSVCFLFVYTIIWNVIAHWSRSVSPDNSGEEVRRIITLYKGFMVSDTMRNSATQCAYSAHSRREDTSFCQK